MDLSQYKVPSREMKFEKIDKDTKSEIYYFDADGKATDKQHAETAIIRELDKNGNLISETYGSITPPQEEKTNPKQR